MESLKLLVKFWDSLEHRDKTWSLNKQTAAAATDPAEREESDLQNCHVIF